MRVYEGTCGHCKRTVHGWRLGRGWFIGLGARIAPRYTWLVGDRGSVHHVRVPLRKLPFTIGKNSPKRTCQER